MLNEELKARITELLPDIAFEEGEWVNAVVTPEAWPSFASSLRNQEDLFFDYLFCLTCIDGLQTAAAKNQLIMVYHLSSTKHRHTLVVKVKLDRNKPEVETVSNIWRSADFLEREVYEMFGVNFINHPDLRLLILPDGWEGKNPLRKDFEDAVNMIRL
jgi:NADH-quinone oxidoreductase subunit C